MGWYLFPVKYTDVYPRDLRSDLADEYILMVAEAYAATHDLRTAAKRLRYWDPAELSVKLKQMSQALAKIEPERSVYLEVLAKDLHLDTAIASPPQSSPATPPRTSSNMPFSSIVGMIAFLALLALAFFLAKRRGLLNFRRVAVPEEAPTPAPSAQHPTDTTFQDIPVHTMPVDQPPSAPYPEPPQERNAGMRDDQEMASADEYKNEYDIMPLPDRESVWRPGYQEQTQIAVEPWAPDDEESTEDFSHPVATPGDFTTVPAPPMAEEEEDLSLEAHPEEEDRATPGLGEFGEVQILRFDGTPDYNVIVPIEIDDDFGQFVLGVAQTAPHNPTQVIALEALLYDRNDIRTVSAWLAPPVLAHDPELLRKYSDKEDEKAFPLQPGQVFHLQTTYLSVTGKVRKVQFGPRTRDGIPVIEFAELEFVAQRAGEGF